MLHYEGAQKGAADAGGPAGTQECALLQKLVEFCVFISAAQHQYTLIMETESRRDW